LKFEKHSSKMVCEEFVLRRLVASPLIKPRFTPGGRQEVKCVPLEGFRRLVMGLDVKDRLSLRSILFTSYCVKESNFAL